jgi:tRNA/rRNA methyltransferase/tRNA (cytidine32/uridine32-2'-O)-methyltransferase
MTPSEIAAFLGNHPGPAALVFGNEQSGLDEKEIGLCNIASHVPVDESFPSINLSHAVQIYAYELFNTLAEAEQGAVKGQWVPLDQKNIVLMVQKLTQVLKGLGFYKQAGREEQEQFLIDLLSRAAISEREGRYFSGIISRAAHLSIILQEDLNV